MIANDATTTFDDELELLTDSIETVHPSEPLGVLIFREPEVDTFLDTQFEELC